MKKLLGIVVLGLLLSGNAFAMSEKQVIEKYFLDRELSNVEGIWEVDFTRDLNIVITTAIYKVGNDRYETKRIDRPGECPPDGIPFTKVSKNFYEKTTNHLDDNCRSTGNKITVGFKVDEGNFGNYLIELGGQKMKAPMTRIWPNNLIAHNKKFKKPEINPDDDKIVPAGSGSGFFVSKDGHAITNYHVIEGCDINKLSFKGVQSEVKILAVDKVNDIALLKSNTKPESIFPVSSEDVSLLEDVVVAGFPLGKQISNAIKTHKGVVTALAGAGDNYSYFQTDAAINQGNSGGPILNQKGNVVGIAVQTWVEEGVQGVHFGIKSSTLKTFANSNGFKFLTPNKRELSNKELGKLITQGTVYIECHMTIAKIKKMIAQTENRKAFFKEHK